jgi:alpha-galactosidase
MMQNSECGQAGKKNRIIARKITAATVAAGFPEPSAWMSAQTTSFCSDWRGENADQERETSVQILWRPETLYFRYHCRYRNIHVFEGGGIQRDGLWMADVAEVFIQSTAIEPKRYREFEISPNGDWLDLDISPGGKAILNCGMKSHVVVDSESRTWTAQMAVPIDCITESFHPEDAWRLNLFRIEGREPDRFYSAWQPTFAPRPNFHVPEVFGFLQFE